MLPTAGLYQQALLLSSIQEPALWSISAESVQHVHEILQSLPPGVRNQRIKCCAPFFVLGVTEPQRILTLVPREVPKALLSYLL